MTMSINNLISYFKKLKKVETPYNTSQTSQGNKYLYWVLKVVDIGEEKDMHELRPKYGRTLGQLGAASKREAEGSTDGILESWMVGEANRRPGS